MWIVSSKIWITRWTVRTLSLDRQFSDLEIGKLDLALDMAVPVHLRGHQIGTVRELDRLIPDV